MGFQGDLDSFGLAAIFQTLTANKQSGTLHVFDEETHRYLVFSQGSIRSVSSGQRKNVSLGEILVAHNTIDEQTLATALSRQARTRELLGDSLVRMGVCGPEDIQRALRFQMEEEIFDLFTWQGARFEFDDGPVDDAIYRETHRVSKVEVNTSQVVMEAMRRIDEWERIARLVPTARMVPVIPFERQDEALLVTLAPDEKRILSFMDGVNDIDAVTRRSCLGRYRVTQFIARLIEQGDVREATADEMRSTAESLVLQGQIEQALQLQRRILELDPQDAATRQALAGSLDALGRPRQAAREYARLAEGYCAVQRFSDAAAACARAAELLPGERDVLCRLACLYVLSEQPREAAGVWARVIRMYEEAGDKPGALERIDEALQDLPEHEDLLRAQARLMIDVGRAREAVAVYERLAALYLNRGDRPGAIVMYRNILHIDGSRTDLQERIKSLQFGEAVVARGRRHKSLAAGVVAGLIALGLLAGLLEWRRNGRIEDVVAEAAAMEKRADAEPLLRRIELLDQAAQLLDRVGDSPTLLGLGEAERRESWLRIQNRLDNDRQQLEDLKARQQTIIDDWQRLRGVRSPESDAAFLRLQELAAGGVGTPLESQAAALVKLHVSERDQRQREVGRWLKIIEEGTDAETRFAALDQLAGAYPQALARVVPDGPLGLTLPVKIATYSEAGNALPASVVIDGRRWPEPTPCTVELPLDPKVPVRIVRRGFGEGESLVRDLPPQRQYRVELKRSPRWKTDLRSPLEGAPLLLRELRLLIGCTTGGDVYALDPSSGRPAWPQVPQAPLKRAAFPRQPLVLAGDRLLVFGESGAAAMLDPRSGRTIWPTGEARDPSPGAVLLGHAEAVDGSGTLAPRGPERILLSLSDTPYLLSLDGATGERLWPRSELQVRALAERVGPVIGPPLHLPQTRRVLVISADGRLHVLLEDGTPAASVAVTTARIEQVLRIERLPGGDARLLLLEAGFGLRCYRISGDAALKAQLLWTREEFVRDPLSAPPLVTDTHLWLGTSSGTIRRVAWEDGAASTRWAFQGLPGPVSGRPGLDGERLLVPCGARDGHPGVLVALQLAPDHVVGVAWEYPAAAGDVSGVVVVPELDAIFFGDGRSMIRLDREGSEP